MNIRNRIIIPFFLLFAAVFGVAIAVSVHLVSRAIESRFVSQVNDLARTLSGFPMTEQFLLDRIRDAFGADVVVSDPKSRKALLTTLNDAARGEFEAWLSRPEESSDHTRAVPFSVGGRDYRVAFAETVFSTHDQREGRKLRFSLLFPGETVAAEENRVIAPLLLTGAAGMVVLLLVGFLIAHRISRPIVLLSRTAQEIASGKLETVVPAVGSGGEIARLTEAFATMLRGLERHREELLRAQQFADMGHLAAGIAHEIRNPLTSMTMTLQTMMREKSGVEREPVDLLLAEVERLDLAVTELFAAAHSSTLRLEPKSLREAVKEVLVLLERRLAHLGVAIAREFEADPVVKMDDKKLKRAIMNLVLNGAEASAGGGRVTITVRSEGDKALLLIRDTGKGIPENLRDKLFQPFVTTKSDGIGIGLAVTHKVIREHGGEIRFETGPAGTTFIIRLPEVARGENPDR